MAAPITHVVLAEKIFNKYFPKKNKKKFFIGTCFPDIRLLANIKREYTHPKVLKILSLKKENSFAAGVAFHSLLDQIRHDFLHTHPKLPKLILVLLKTGLLKSPNPNFEERARLNGCSKLLEDELFYEEITDWKRYINFLETILPEEVSFNIPKNTIIRWHKTLQQYFFQKPNEQTRSKLLSRLSFPKKEIVLRNEIINKMKDIPIITNLLWEFHKNFKDYLLAR